MIPRKEYAVTLQQVGLWHVHIFRMKYILQCCYSISIQLKPFQFPGLYLNYSKFWKEYTDGFISKLASSNFDLASTKLKEWVRQEQIPSHAYHPEMFRKPSCPKRYGRCILYSTCTGRSANVTSYASVVTNEACLKSTQRQDSASCQKENLILLEVAYST